MPCGAVVCRAAVFNQRTTTKDHTRHHGIDSRHRLKAQTQGIDSRLYGLSLVWTRAAWNDFIAVGWLRRASSGTLFPRSRSWNSYRRIGTACGGREWWLKALTGWGGSDDHHCPLGEELLPACFPIRVLRYPLMVSCLYALRGQHFSSAVLCLPPRKKRILFPAPPEASRTRRQSPCAETA